MNHVLAACASSNIVSDPIYNLQYIITLIKTFIFKLRQPSLLLHDYENCVCCLPTKRDILLTFSTYTYVRTYCFICYSLCFNIYSSELAMHFYTDVISAIVLSQSLFFTKECLPIRPGKDLNPGPFLRHRALAT